MAGQPAPGHDEVAVPVALATDRLLDLLRTDPELLALAGGFAARTHGRGL